MRNMSKIESVLHLM